MSAVATAIVGATVVGGMMASDAQQDAANTAANAQQGMSQAQIAESRRQFDETAKMSMARYEEIQKLLKPYVTAGNSAVAGLAPFQLAGEKALTQQENLLGLNGDAYERLAIQRLNASPEMEAYIKQGENAIRQNASATGNLRGGNIQGALAQFRPQMLAQLIDKQFGRLGGLSAMGNQTTANVAQLGQASAAGVGSAGQTSAAQVAQAGQVASGQINSALGQIGASQAGAALASGKAEAQMWGQVSSLPAMLYGMGVFKGF